MGRPRWFSTLPLLGLSPNDCLQIHLHRVQPDLPQLSSGNCQRFFGTPHAQPSENWYPRESVRTLARGTVRVSTARPATKSFSGPLAQAGRENIAWLLGSPLVATTQPTPTKPPNRTSHFHGCVGGLGGFNSVLQRKI